LADDPSVDVVALAVDLVPEYDGDTATVAAIEAAHDRTDKPVVVLTNLASAVDQAAAARLRARGVPVLEGTRSGLQAISHLLAHATPPGRAAAEPIDTARRSRWSDRLDREPFPDWLDLVADYGIPVVPHRRASTGAEAVTAAGEIGYPVVLKTAAVGISHKVDVDGVRLDLPDADAVRAAHADLARRLGPEVLVQPQVSPGVELALGVVRDPLLGPLVMVAAGGSLVELLSQRAMALPPIDRAGAESLIARLPSSRLLCGHRGRPPGDLAAVVDALLAMSRLALELGDRIEALDVNPLIVSATGAVAVDALVTPGPRPDRGTG
jgi:acyl-CoA synthetase (NDP forming)